MRDAGGRTYAQNLKAVLLSPAVRYLVKDAVAYWLGEVVDPTPQELTIVEECLNAEATSNLAKVVINGRNWLPRLVESGAIDRLLSQGDSLRDLALWVLKKGCSSHSELVAGYMRQWWEAAPDEHQAELVAWFERLYPEGSIGQLLSLYADLIDAVPPSSINENFEANFELGSWVHKDRLLGAKVLGLWLTAWMRAFPTSQPFSDYRHNSHSYWVDELAKHEPIALLEATVPAFVEALKREKANLASGDLGYPSLRPPHSEHDQQYLRAILQAVETVSARDPAQAEKFIDKFSGDSDVELFVQLRAIAANGEVLGHRLVDLLGATRIFKVGDGHADWLPFAVAAAAALPHLELPERTQVEQAVLSYRPEYDWAREYRRRDKADELHFRPENPDKYVIDQLNINGQDERAILKTIGRDQLSAAARSRLDELDRKFPGARLPEAYGVRGGIVRSPIPPDKARFMSDAQWLNAMLRYADDSHHVYERDGVLGGARQLSSALQARVVEEPARFVALLDSLPVTVNAEYAEAVVAGLREAEVDGPLVARAIKAASRWPAAEFGRMAIWSVRKHPSSAQDAEVFAHVIQSAEHGSASDTAVTTMSSPGGKKEKETAREMLQGDGDLASSGLNSERGAAYEALATILWELEETLAPVVALLERAIETEPLVSVRFYMVHAINSVGKYDPDLAVDLLRRLVADDKRPLQGHHGHHIVGWVAHRSPGVIAEFSEELIKSSETELRALGHFFEALLALIYGDRNVEFVKSFQESALRRQVAGYRGGANVSSDHYGDRAAGWLMPLFSDENSLVRNDASGVEWGALLDGERDRSELVSAYIASPSFDENSDNLMRALEQRASKFPQLTFEAVNRILELASAWTDVARRGHFSTLHNLSRVLIELYRSADADSEGERKVLDLFDDYLARDLYDIRSEISAYERH
jgi:hypothetical protein